MRKVGDLWILEDDLFFATYLARTRGRFDYDHLLGALKYVTNWKIAVDCGAHYGTWTIPMSERFEKVIAFEGRADLYECLKLNIKHIDNIDARQVAVGDKYGDVTVGSGKWKGRDGNSGIATVTGPGPVPMIPIDSLELDEVGFLKIDVEGFELFVLRGAIETIRRCKPIVLFEENLRGELEHGIAKGQAGKFLRNIGMHQVAVYPGKDYVYAWK